jgi:uncharacterized protein YdeI (YjbR/CyaY-like superfamily)
MATAKKPGAAAKAPIRASAKTRELPVKAFASLEAWEKWLAAQPAASKGVWLKLAKQSAKSRSVSRQEAIDGALCHGWIDGKLDKFNEDWWLVRFTPRKPKGKWSEKNRARAIVLMKKGRVAPAGMREIEQAKKDGRWAEAYASQSKATVQDDLEKALAKNGSARSFFATLDVANRYAILYRIHTAKPNARAQRVALYIGMLSRGETIHLRKGVSNT